MHGEVVGDVLEEDRAFLRALRDERQILSTAEDGRKALEVVLAAQKSVRDGAPVLL